MRFTRSWMFLTLMLAVLVSVTACGTTDPSKSLENDNRIYAGYELHDVDGVPAKSFVLDAATHRMVSFEDIAIGTECGCVPRENPYLHYMDTYIPTSSGGQSQQKSVRLTGQWTKAGPLQFRMLNWDSTYVTFTVTSVDSAYFIDSHGRKFNFGHPPL